MRRTPADSCFGTIRTQAISDTRPPTGALTGTFGTRDVVGVGGSRPHTDHAHPTAALGQGAVAAHRSGSTLPAYGGAPGQGDAANHRGENVLHQQHSTTTTTAETTTTTTAGATLGTMRHQPASLTRVTAIWSGKQTRVAVRPAARRDGSHWSVNLTIMCTGTLQRHLGRQDWNSLMRNVN